VLPIKAEGRKPEEEGEEEGREAEKKVREVKEGRATAAEWVGGEQAGRRSSPRVGEGRSGARGAAAAGKDSEEIKEVQVVEEDEEDEGITGDRLNPETTNKQAKGEKKSDDCDGGVEGERERGREGSEERERESWRGGREGGAFWMGPDAEKIGEKQREKKKRKRKRKRKSKTSGKERLPGESKGK